VDEWQSADERNNREKIDRARKAAEDLFKPAHPSADPEPTGPVANDSTPKEQRSQRQPRIFTVPPRLPLNPKPDRSVVAEPVRRRAVARRPGKAVPPSQIGRVRTLATYGMTPKQVAELYGVSVDEINRILKAPAYSAKWR
jgi:hypothetical protein